jgi:hypothetical protein
VVGMVIVHPQASNPYIELSKFQVEFY